MEPLGEHGRRSAMRAFPRLAIAIALSALVAACGAPASSGPSIGSPSPSAGGVGTLDHASGATDILLRYDQGGGFVPIEFFASHVPIFTLYGDGTVIFRRQAEDALPAVGNVRPNRPLRTTRLTEAQIQTTLREAINEGGLGVARANYTNDLVADASTATFLLNAGGVSKGVSVYALGIDAPGMADAAARAAFGRLARRLGDFDQGGTITSGEYVPDRYRGVLMDGGAGGLAKPWPWPELKPIDFVVPADANGVRLPATVLTVGQAETLGIRPYTGGFQGLTLVGPGGDGTYAFTLRPLLPDDDA